MSEGTIAVSLFSGAGGLDIASFMAGVPVVSSTDLDADCIQTLKSNEDFFGHTKILEGDLHQIESGVFKDIGWATTHERASTTQERHSLMSICV